jgi:hypothetical protein
LISTGLNSEFISKQRETVERRTGIANSHPINTNYSFMSSDVAQERIYVFPYTSGTRRVRGLMISSITGRGISMLITIPSHPQLIRPHDRHPERLLQCQIRNSTTMYPIYGTVLTVPTPPSHPRPCIPRPLNTHLQPGRPLRVLPSLPISSGCYRICKGFSIEVMRSGKGWRGRKRSGGL